MKKNNRIASLEKVFSRSCSPGTGREIVNKSDSLILERNSSTAGGDKNDSSVRLRVVCYKGFGKFDVGIQVCWRGIVIEIVGLV